MKKKSKKWIIWSLVIIILIIIVTVALSSNSNGDENGRSTVKVTREDIVDKALAVGSIEPVTEIDVKSKISGVVRKLYANVGDFVRVGDPLLDVKPDPTPLELAQAKRNVERRGNRRPELTPRHAAYHLDEVSRSGIDREVIEG